MSIQQPKRVRSRLGLGRAYLVLCRNRYTCMSELAPLKYDATTISRRSQLPSAASMSVTATDVQKYRQRQREEPNATATTTQKRQHHHSFSNTTTINPEPAFTTAFERGLLTLLGHYHHWICYQYY